VYNAKHLNFTDNPCATRSNFISDTVFLLLQLMERKVIN